MARGWESKSIESQQEDRDAARAGRKVQVSPEERAREEQQRALLLSRARIVSQLEACRTEAHRASLESALAFLDAELQKLK